MPELVWDKPEERTYEAGVYHGILYPKNGPGVVWNGLISVDIDSPGGESESLYLDGIKYFDLLSKGEFQATITAFTYPKEFEPALGNRELGEGTYIGNQPRESFGLAWRTRRGDSLNGLNRYRQHMVWDCVVQPSPASYQTHTEAIQPLIFTWVIKATPRMPGIPPPNEDDPTPGDWEWPEPGDYNWPPGPDGNTDIDGWEPWPYVHHDPKDPEDPDNPVPPDDPFEPPGDPDDPDYPQQPDLPDVLDHLNNENGPYPPEDFPFPPGTPPSYYPSGPINAAGDSDGIGYIMANDQLPWEDDRVGVIDPYIPDGEGPTFVEGNNYYAFDEEPEIFDGTDLSVLGSPDNDSYMRIRNYPIMMADWDSTQNQHRMAYLLKFPPIPMSTTSLAQGKWTLNTRFNLVTSDGFSDTFTVQCVFCDVRDITDLMGFDEGASELGGEGHMFAEGSTMYGHARLGDDYVWPGWDNVNFDCKDIITDYGNATATASLARAGNLGTLIYLQNDLQNLDSFVFLSRFAFTFDPNP